MQRQQKESVRLDLEGEEVEKLQWVRQKRGFTLNTELIRILITEEFQRLGGKLERDRPRFEQINFDDSGIKLFDRKMGQVAQIQFKREGIQCSLDETDDCEHIRYILGLKSVQKILRKKRKEGWKLPDV